jgi:hypothetical protein
VSRRPKAAAQYEESLSYLGGPQTLPLIKEEVWRDAKGTVTRYSLAYIDPMIFPGDNGRVLGYDNAHGHHHRHFCGEVTPYGYATYEQVARQFLREANQLWRKR